MRRNKTIEPMARSAIVAMAERAVACGATSAVLVYIDSDGDRIAVSLPEMDELQTAGLLALAVSDFAANAIAGAYKEDFE